MKLYLSLAVIVFAIGGLLSISSLTTGDGTQELVQLWRIGGAMLFGGGAMLAMGIVAWLMENM